MTIVEEIVLAFPVGNPSTDSSGVTWFTTGNVDLRQLVQFLGKKRLDLSPSPPMNYPAAGDFVSSTFGMPMAICWDFHFSRPAKPCPASSISAKPSTGSSAKFTKSTPLISPAASTSPSCCARDTGPGQSARGSKMSYKMPMGPYHPGLEEPYKLEMICEGETICDAKAHIGFNFRGIEHLAETRNYVQVIALMERVCGICSNIHTLTLCQAMEKLCALGLHRAPNTFASSWPSSSACIRTCSGPASRPSSWASKPCSWPALNTARRSWTFFRPSPEIA